MRAGWVFIGVFGLVALGCGPSKAPQVAMTASVPEATSGHFEGEMYRYDKPYDEVLQESKQIANDVYAAEELTPSVCTAGLHINAFWPGEYPSPVVQVNARVSVPARASSCGVPRALRCTLEPGLYHPWSPEPIGEFEEVRASWRYVATRDTELDGYAFSKGTEVIVPAYLSEGFCLVLVEGVQTEMTCPGMGDDDGFQEIVNPNVGEPEQFLGVQCAEGYRAWILVNDALFSYPEIVEGDITGWGMVGPAGSASF